MTAEEYFEIKAKNAGMTPDEYFLESCRLESLAKPEDPSIEDFYQRMKSRPLDAWVEEIGIVDVEEFLA